MGNVDRFMSEPLLVGEAADAFDRRRKRVAARQDNWRKNFPAVGLLLDCDEDRAQALAGNYATEARETVAVWLSSFEVGPPTEGDIEAQVEWVEGYWEAWRDQVFGSDDFDRLADGPRRRFVSVFDDLRERFLADAVAFVRDGGARDARRPSLTSRLLVPLRSLGGAFKGFFFPR